MKRRLRDKISSQFHDNSCNILEYISKVGKVSAIVPLSLLNFPALIPCLEISEIFESCCICEIHITGIHLFSEYQGNS